MTDHPPRGRAARLHTRLTDRDLQVLDSLYQLRLLTARQVQRLHVYDGSVSTRARRTRALLQRLSELGVVVRLARSIGGVQPGSTAHVYGLSGLGLAVLDVQGPYGRRRRTVWETKPYFLQHVLAVSELCVGLTEQARSGHAELLAFDGEPACWRRFAGPAGVPVVLKPDAFVRVGLGEFERHAFVEADMATESLPTVIRKCRSYESYWRSGVEQRAHGVWPLVVWLVPNADRLNKVQEVIGGLVADIRQLVRRLAIRRTSTANSPSRRDGMNMTREPRPTTAALPLGQILVGDAATRLAELPDSSVDSVITSPPYFALRDYGEPGQIGLEPTVEAWVASLMSVAKQIQRVLKPTGGLWLNVADSYAHHPKEGAPKKSLLLGPQRLALALVADGWLLRNHIIWHKTNPMPSNVTDRLSCTHESVYFLTRQGQYFFDLDVIRRPHKDHRVHGSRDSGSDRIYPPVGVLPRRSARAGDVNDGLGRMKAAGVVGHPLGGNPGDVWPLATAAFRGEHFATFPASLVERPLLATCPERTCPVCGAPWQRAKQNLHGRLLATGPLQPDCGCRAGWRPGVVLDPFLGAGTTALVAEQHNRDWVGVELSPTFADLAHQRLADWRKTQGTASG